MASNYSTPGVYIEEINAFPPSIAQVPTAIPAFIGHTERAQRKEADDLLLKPFKINSMVEYRQYFGGPQPEDQFQIEIIEFESGASPAIKVEFNGGNNSKFIMYYALEHFFANGGGSCYIVSVWNYDNGLDGGTNTLSDGLTALETIDEVTLILFPEAQELAASNNYYDLATQALLQCENLKDRFAIIDVFNKDSEYNVDSFIDTQNNPGTGLRDLISENLKYGAVYYPNLETSLNYQYEESAVNITSHILKMGDGTEEDPPTSRLSINGSTLEDAKTTRNDLYAIVKNEIEQKPLILPPGPAMAGIYARVDDARGVWKAPANVGINSVIGPVFNLTKAQNDELNIDVNAGKSVNAIRSFAGKGTLVWGARTLDGNDNEWRYISVRRFFNMAEESIKKASERFVFEPNNKNTWVKVKSMIENFLLIQWRNGALVGDVPEHAFKVFVGLGQTMTAQDILEGRMNVEVHMAAVRPAEFIICKFMHKMQES